MGLKGFIWYSSPVKRIKSSVTDILPSDNIWERDWDVLIILDACRADLFTEVIDDCEIIRSPASTSSTWIKRTFNRDISKVGYVTGNGHLDEMPSEEFAYFHIERTRKTNYGIETVPPTPLVDHAIHAWRNRDKYELDRLIVHFMQPHAPFRSKLEWFTSKERDDGISAFIWQRLKEGEFDQQEVWNAYMDNLSWVWENGVSVLAENLDADIAVSADHGNALGEYGIYGHPMGCPIKEVRTVPWYKIRGKDTDSYNPEIKDQNNIINKRNIFVHLATGIVQITNRIRQLREKIGSHSTNKNPKKLATTCFHPSLHREKSDGSYSPMAV